MSKWNGKTCTHTAPQPETADGRNECGTVMTEKGMVSAAFYLSALAFLFSPLFCTYVKSPATITGALKWTFSQQWTVYASVCVRVACVCVLRDFNVLCTDTQSKQNKSFLLLLCAITFKWNAANAGHLRYRTEGRFPTDYYFRNGALALAYLSCGGTSLWLQVF